MADEIAENGWTSVPVDAGKLFNQRPFINTPTPLFVKDISFPQSELVAEVQQYAQRHLTRQCYHHSMRVFYFGTAILRQQFPEHVAALSPATLALTCLLHDLGTTSENLSATHMSFEFYGAIKALNLLKSLHATDDQAEAVCETIIRHQDLGSEGNITLLGQIIQLATIYDNVGSHPMVEDFSTILHQQTREDVIQAFPREGWLGCFAQVIREEEKLKPWCHSTHIPDFDKQIEANELMKPYE